VVLDRRQRTYREVSVGSDPAGSVDKCDAMFHLAAKLMYGCLPCRRVCRERRANQKRLILQGTRDLPFQVASEGTLGDPEQNCHGENEN
jgi:hypothetical protein